MKKTLKWALLASTIIFVGMILVIIAAVAASGRVSSDSVLHVVVDGGLRESPDESPFAALEGGSTPTLRSVTDSVRRAAADERIVGLILEVKNVHIAMAQLEEIEGAMATFRATGKWNVGFLETAGEFDRGSGAYALATCADEVVLAPPGDINLIGLQATVPFIKNSLERLNVKVRFDQRHEYKNAANMFTQTEMTEAHREATGTLVDDLQKHIVAHIAARRGVDEAKALTLVADGPYIAQAAVEVGLVDRLAYWDELRAEAEQKFDNEEPLVSLNKYAATGELHDSGPTVALIYGDGTVGRGKSGDDAMGSDTVTQAFRDAREEEVEGVLFRINSPGGSYVASDLIRREVAVTREAGIPVVVSMGGLAASGGYFVAMNADRIVAQPSTITGSIGVYGGTFGLREFWEHWVGMSLDEYATTDNADFFSWIDLPTGPAKKKHALFLDRIYDDFVAKVAAGRSLEPAKTAEIARGRVWSGTRALELGLVDMLGGTEVALAELKKLMKVADEDDIELRTFPAPMSTFEALEEVFSEASVLTGWIRQGARLADTRTGVLRMPELEVH